MPSNPENLAQPLLHEWLSQGLLLAEHHIVLVLAEDANIGLLNDANQDHHLERSLLGSTLNPMPLGGN